MITKVDLFEDLKTDKIYHNTLLVLQQYKKVLWRINKDINDIDLESKEKVGLGLNDYTYAFLDIDTSFDAKRLKGRLRSLENSKSLINLIDDALVILYDYPDKGNLYFEIISKGYLNYFKYSVEEMLDTFSFSRRTYYRERKKAITILGIILWGFLIPTSDKSNI